MDKYTAHLILNRVKDGDMSVSDVEVALALKATGDVPNLEGDVNGKQKERHELVSWVSQTREEWGLPEKGQS